MIGLAFELIEWSIKLLIISIWLIAIGLYWLAKVMLIVGAFLVVAVVALWQHYQQRRRARVAL